MTPVELLGRLISRLPNDSEGSRSQRRNSTLKATRDLMKKLPSSLNPEKDLWNNGPSGDRILVEYLLGISNTPDLCLADIAHYYKLSGIEIISIEPVLRQELLQRFHTAGTILYQNPDTHSLPNYGTWDIAFHGTLAHKVGPITESGFLLPGHRGHKSRFLANWGPGIYCSPAGMYTVEYSKPDYREALQPNQVTAIFVVAVFRGRPHVVDHNRCQQYKGLESGFDSHVEQGFVGYNLPIEICQYEWIVFDPGRIVPLCLLWISTKGEQRRPQWQLDEKRRYPKARTGDAEDRMAVDLVWGNGPNGGLQRYRGDTKFNLQKVKDAIIEVSTIWKND